MQVSNKGVAALMRVRLALETLAVREALAQPGGPERFDRLRHAAHGFADATRASDPALHVLAEQEFHAELCRSAGNPPLLALWQSLARQLAVIWGLALQLRDSGRKARNTTPCSRRSRTATRPAPWRDPG